MSRSGQLAVAAEERFWRGVRAAGRFFMGTADVQKALDQLVWTLDALHIPYAIVDALDVNEFGYQRTTVDVDVLLTAEGLSAFKQAMLGRGYVGGSLEVAACGIRSTASRSTSFWRESTPVTGNPSRWLFPIRRPPRSARGAAPADHARRAQARVRHDGAARLKDLADVQELIRLQQLPRTLADMVDPFVRGKYLELWQAVQDHSDDQVR